MKTENQIQHKSRALRKKIKVLEYHESKSEFDLIYLRGMLFALLWVMELA